MPFQSEKQRRYLWANEPEIARDWTDRYGARGGGIMRIPFANGSFKNWLGNVTGYTQHNINNQLLKDALSSNQITEEQYKTMGGYDVAQNMPLGKLDFINKAAPVGIASGVYQLAKLAAGSDWNKRLGLIDDSMGMSKYGNIGPYKSWELNTRGSQGLSPTDKALYHNIMTPRSKFQDDYNSDPIASRMANLDKFTPKVPDRIKDAMSKRNEIIKSPSKNFQYYPPSQDLEAQNIRPTFDSSDEEQDYYNQISNKIGKMPTIKDPNMFQRFRNKFYKPATRNVGGYNVAQLNKMNALGGYYSEPAREARRFDKRGINVLNRAAAGKKVGNVNKLLGQYGYEGGALGSGDISFTGKPQGDPTAGAGYSRRDDSWGASPFRGGGLASLWPR